MAQFLIFSDIHIFAHKRKLERLEDCLSVLDWVFDTARKYNIKNILFGGDFFHDRQKIEVYTYQRAFEALSKNLTNNPAHLWLLLGNHDLWFNEKTSISSVIPLSALPNIHIIDKPSRLIIDNIPWDFVPFTHDPISSVQELKVLPGKADFCLGHIALDGAQLHGDTLSEVAVEHDGDMVKVSSNLFSHYKQAFFGHYHAAQILDDVCEYVGSPLQLSFGEAGQTKNILLFDTDNLKKTYIPNDFSPKHLVIRNPKDLKKHDLQKNFVKLWVDDLGATNIIQLRKEILENAAPGSLEIKQAKKITEEHVIQDAKAILFQEDAMMTRYVDEVGTNGLDRELLLTIGKTICSKV